LARNRLGGRERTPWRGLDGVEWDAGSEKTMEITSDYLAQAMSLSTAQTVAIPQTQQQTEAVQAVNQTELLGYDNQLVYTRDPATDRNVIKVVSRSTGETVGQLPPETVVQMAAFLKGQ
jgi:uncharacterized FlaG/YvyC family protein